MAAVLPPTPVLSVFMRRGRCVTSFGLAGLTGNCRKWKAEPMPRHHRPCVSPTTPAIGAAAVAPPLVGSAPASFTAGPDRGALDVRVVEFVSQKTVPEPVDRHLSVSRHGVGDGWRQVVQIIRCRDREKAQSADIAILPRINHAIEKRDDRSVTGCGVGPFQSVAGHRAIGLEHPEQCLSLSERVAGRPENDPGDTGQDPSYHRSIAKAPERRRGHLQHLILIACARVRHRGRSYPMSSTMFMGGGILQHTGAQRTRRKPLQTGSSMSEIRVTVAKRCDRPRVDHDRRMYPKLMAELPVSCRTGPSLRRSCGLP